MIIENVKFTENGKVKYVWWALYRMVPMSVISRISIGMQIYVLIIINKILHFR